MDMTNQFVKKDRYEMQDLLQIMALLRGEGGCPWDQKQTHESIRNNFLEETYEALEAIDAKDPAMLREELGDVLLQVVFHAQMEQEAGHFDFGDVCNEICQKLIVRHPHIFADVVAQTSEEVLTNWDQIKMQTKGQKAASETLESVPKILPALMRAAKVQSRAGKAGFDYPDLDWAFRDLQSEVEELREGIACQNRENCDEELGDLLFAAVNVSRFLKLDAEESLSKACNKFIRRFTQVERLAQQRGVDMKSASLQELDGLWKEAKQTERASGVDF